MGRFRSLTLKTLITLFTLLVGVTVDHDDIRKHVIKRAKALGHPEAIPDNWNPDGSLSDDVTILIRTLRAALKEA